MMKNNYCPRARDNDLMISKVGEEIVVYDTRTNKASCLNPLTSAVWDACNGNNDLTCILEQVKRSGFPDSNIELVKKAIDLLDQVDLLENQSVPGEKELTDRRNLVRMFGLGAMGAVLLISTVLVQPAMAQMSGPCLQNGPCDPIIPCCPNRVCRRNNNGNGPLRCRRIL